MSRFNCARCGKIHPICDHQQPNARLIAATPDLVRACIALVEWYEWGGDMPEMLVEAVDAANAALDAAGVTEQLNTRQSNGTNGQ